MHLEILMFHSLSESKNSIHFGLSEILVLLFNTKVSILKSSVPCGTALIHTSLLSVKLMFFQELLHPSPLQTVSNITL